MAEPYCLAMVLCDGVHQDRGSGKFTLLGTFHTFTAQEYPADVVFTVYFAVTDGKGVVNIRIRIVDASHDIDEDSVPVFEPEPTPMKFEDPLVVMEGVALIKGRLPSPGLYHCELYANDELLMSRRVLAVQFGKENQDE